MNCTTNLLLHTRVNTVYAPVQQTKLVNALAEIQGVDDRAQFVKFAVLTRDPEVAPGTPR